MKRQPSNLGLTLVRLGIVGLGLVGCVDAPEFDRDTACDEEVNSGDCAVGTDSSDDEDPEEMGAFGGDENDASRPAPTMSSPSELPDGSIAAADDADSGALSGGMGPEGMGSGGMGSKGRDAGAARVPDAGSGDDGGVVVSTPDGGQLSVCGNGDLDEGEECDQGHSQNQGAYGGCNPDCTLAAYCGDGTQDADEEECDDGDDLNLGQYGGCQSDCQLAPYCGDGEITDGEQCDPQSASGGDDCDDECGLVQICGDGKITGDEVCDNGDGNTGDYGGCTSSCERAPYCGDSMVEAGEEECDDGINDGGYGESCDSNCQRPAYCGDGQLDSPYEQCDLGSDNSGDYEGCNPDCTLAPYCGDGDTNDGEECDEGTGGNNGDYEGCTAGCVRSAFCGDGQLDVGHEECDEGVSNGTEASLCTDDCTQIEWDPCQPGTYVASAGTATQPPVCTPCEAGTFSSQSNTSECSVCPLGHVSTSEGATECQFAQVSAGTSHTCLLLTNGSVRCWGSNDSYELGYGEDIVEFGEGLDAVDAGIVNLPVAAVQVAAGETATCAVLSTGDLRCWGDDYWGKLGRSTFDATSDALPSSVSGLDGPTQRAAVGWGHTCNLLKSGEVNCWGRDWNNELGYHSPTPGESRNTRPGVAVTFGDSSTATRIAAYATYTCAVHTGGELYCWGEIGDEEESFDPGYIKQMDVGGDVADVGIGWDHACALRDDGDVVCWGPGSVLGYGSTAHVSDPSTVGAVDIGGRVVQLAVGGRHNCALLEGGNLRCWGWGGFGQLGYGTNDNVGVEQTPAEYGQFVDVGGPVTQVTAGSWHTCALRTDGKVFCWGQSGAKLGYGVSYSIGDDETPATQGPVPTSVLPSSDAP